MTGTFRRGRGRGEDVERLLHGLVFRHRDEHDVGAPVAGDREVVVLARHPIGELGTQEGRGLDAVSRGRTQTKDRLIFQQIYLRQAEPDGASETEMAAMEA